LISGAGALISGAGALISRCAATVATPIPTARASIGSTAEITTFAARARFVDDDGAAELDTPVECREGIL
jgi:hypothetical protein